MKDINTIGVADGEGQDMGEAQTEACVPVSELRGKLAELREYEADLWPDDDKAIHDKGMSLGVKKATDSVEQLADKYDSNE